MNEELVVVGDLELDIKTTITKSVLSGQSFTQTKKEVNDTIKMGLENLEDAAEITYYKKRFRAFAEKFYFAFLIALTLSPGIVEQIRRAILNPKKSPVFIKVVRQILRNPLKFVEQSTGLPADLNDDRYNKLVQDAIKKMVDEVPNSTDKGGSLRSRAELKVRHESHEANLAALEQENVDLVIVSVHQDCSDRCAPYQGKIYSLKGKTKGYKKLSEVIGKNKLFGYNCRHSIKAFTSETQPTYVSSATRNKENEITKKQREFERKLRAQEQEAAMLLNVNKVKAATILKERTKLYEEYQRFSHKNNRAFYPNRTHN